MSKSILDTLTGLDKRVEEVLIEEEEIEAFPEKCLVCKTNVLCNLIPTFANMARIGIIVELKKCPFHNDIRNPQSKE
jgi:hypothetical protein